MNRAATESGLVFKRPVRSVSLMLVLLLWLGGCSSPPGPVRPKPSATAAPANAEFVGSASCLKCHAQEHQAWETSHHHQAMGLPSPATVRGNFDNAKFEYFGFRSRFFKKDDEYWVETDGLDGLRKAFKIEYTFGVEPLQQYLVRFPDGRLQALGIAWDTEKKRWFHLHPEEKITFKSPLHWTSPQYNWNSMCAECHSTGLEKNYDPVKDTYDTTYKEINVSCEACHGPPQTTFSR